MSDVMLMHATAVAVRGQAVLLRGPSGAGKSDLALRLINIDGAFSQPVGRASSSSVAATAEERAGMCLLADDQVRLERHGDAVIASAPETIRGLIEVRGLGIVRVPFVASARVRLVIDLVAASDVPRMAPEGRTVALLGVQIPLLELHAFEASAALKCGLALRDAVSAAARSSAQ